MDSTLARCILPVENQTRMFLASLITWQAVRTTVPPFHFTKTPLPIDRVVAQVAAEDSHDGGSVAHGPLVSPSGMGSRGWRARDGRRGTGDLQLAIQLELQSLDRRDAGHAIYFGRPLDHDETGNGVDAVLSGQPGLMVDIDPADRIAGASQAFDRRRHRLARTAPIGVEVEKDGGGGTRGGGRKHRRRGRSPRRRRRQ